MKSTGNASELTLMLWDRDDHKPAWIRWAKRYIRRAARRDGKMMIWRDAV